MEAEHTAAKDIHQARHRAFGDGERTARSRFYLQLSLAFVAIAVAGFSTTFFVPLARGTFAAPTVIHVHGALMFTWLLLFVAQAALVLQRRVRAHRRAGWFGVVLAGAIVISGVMAGRFASVRDLAASGQDWPYGAFVNIVIEMLVFGGLVTAAVALRRRPEAHKRLLVLATISALGPAWFRFRHFLPFVPNPTVSFAIVADALLLVVLARDWRGMRRVHPAYVWGGGVMVAVHAIELLAAESRTWLDFGRWLLA